MDFRRDFTLAEVPESAELRIAADSKYYLYVNGEQVVYEGGLNRANTAYTYYDVVDVADYLVEGANSFAVLLWYWGGETEANITNQSLSTAAVRGRFRAATECGMRGKTAPTSRG